MKNKEYEASIIYEMLCRPNNHSSNIISSTKIHTLQNLLDNQKRIKKYSTQLENIIKNHHDVKNNYNFLKETMENLVDTLIYENEYRLLHINDNKHESLRKIIKFESEYKKLISDTNKKSERETKYDINFEKIVNELEQEIINKNNKFEDIKEFIDKSKGKKVDKNILRSIINKGDITNKIQKIERYKKYYNVMNKYSEKAFSI